MQDVTNENVLVLNRNWQAIDEITAAVAFADMFRDSACAIDTTEMRAVPITEWLKLPIRDTDRVIQTVRGPIRVPTVIVKSSFSKMPHRRPRLDRKSIGERDGYRCGYTGKTVPHGIGTIDHVIPVSRGGAKKSWKNQVWCAPEVNAEKGNKLNSEAGLVLRHEPFEPSPQPVCALIKPRADKPDWNMFLKLK